MKNTYRTQTNIVPLDVLGGRMYAERLKAEGVMSIISSKTGFMRRQAADTRGRALIAKEMLPYGVCACRWIAAWIWTGENFPRNVDIISDRHFRAKTHGKTILTHNQNIMHKSEYSGMFGDYSSYSAEYDELTEDAADEEE